MTLLFLTSPVAAQDIGVPVRVADRETASPIAGIEVLSTDQLGVTDSSGRVVLQLPPGRHRLVLTGIGFVPLDTLVEVPPLDTIRLWLTPRPLELEPLAVRARRTEGGADRERALFHREPVPGLVGISRLELAEQPALGEVDVMRGLQSLPGVASANDMSARLHVRGGAPDQNVYLLDGARVLAPYHMFGIFGGFNPDAVGRAEIYRGSFPARHGGALSSVVDFQHRPGSAEEVEGSGGVGMLGARMTVTAPLPGDGSWMLAGRRTHADLVLDRYSERGFPYSFWDVHGQATARLAPNHRIRTSGFASDDRFRMFLESVSDRMDSRWSNAVGSAQWDWTLGRGSGLSTLVWGTGYSSSLDIGGGVDRPNSANDVSLMGISISFSRRGEDAGWRAGLDLDGGEVELVGSPQAGGLFQGTRRTRYLSPAGFFEYEHRVGSIRFAPGLRIESFLGAGLVLAPRLFSRLYLSEDVALTAGLTRSYQALSTLRDDRFPLPGPPFWFAHGEDQPVSRSDAAVLALEGWFATRYSFEASAYVRSFRDVARWRPTDARTLAGLRFDDGAATGISASLRRHQGRLTGWLGYEYLSVTLTEEESGVEYTPPWEHTHTLELAASLRPWGRATITGQMTFATGAPFWPQTGVVTMWRLDPLRGTIGDGGHTPTWADTQLRLPQYFRADLAFRWPFDWGKFAITPHVNVLNLTGRQNVMYYILRNDIGRPWLFPELQLPIPIAFPSLGVDVSF